jgi:hypothetical protein
MKNNNLEEHQPKSLPGGQEKIKIIIMNILTSIASTLPIDASDSFHFI